MATQCELRLILLAGFANVFVGLEMLDHPPLITAATEVAVAESTNFGECVDIMRKIAAETNSALEGVSYHQSLQWGFVMRGILRGAMTNDFVCWRDPEGGGAQFWIETR